MMSKITYHIHSRREWFIICLNFSEESVLRNFLKELGRQLTGHEVGGDGKTIPWSCGTNGQGPVGSEMHPVKQTEQRQVGRVRGGMCGGVVRAGLGRGHRGWEMKK